MEELAEEAGIPVRTLRFYRERGLLPPPRREGRIAWYDDHHLARLRTIAGLLERGHTLSGIADLAAAFEHGRDVGRGAGPGRRRPRRPRSASRPRSSPTTSRARSRPENLAASLDLGYLATDGDEIVHVSRRLLDVSSALVREGVPLAAVLRRGPPGPRARRRPRRPLRRRVLRTHAADDRPERLRPLAKSVVEAELSMALDRHCARRRDPARTDPRTTRSADGATVGSRPSDRRPARTTTVTGAWSRPPLAVRRGPLHPRLHGRAASPRRRHLVVDAPAGVVVEGPPAVGPPGVRALLLRVQRADHVHVRRPRRTPASATRAPRAGSRSSCGWPSSSSGRPPGARCSSRRTPPPRARRRPPAPQRPEVGQELVHEAVPSRPAARCRPRRRAGRGWRPSRPAGPPRRTGRRCRTPRSPEADPHPLGLRRVPGRARPRPGPWRRPGANTVCQPSGSRTSSGSCCASARTSCRQTTSASVCRQPLDEALLGGGAEPVHIHGGHSEHPGTYRHRCSDAIRCTMSAA